jgi:hypothetical protein
MHFLKLKTPAASCGECARCGGSEVGNNPFSAEVAMDNLTFGLTLLVVGMGGTLVALGLLALIMGLLKKIFPFKEESSN